MNSPVWSEAECRMECGVCSCQKTHTSARGFVGYQLRYAEEVDKN
ncbi:hypothetical protein [Algoriphagus hitonicola]|nr:hypothetical protein [Algoriphagus hitonicola]